MRIILLFAALLAAPAHGADFPYGHLATAGFATPPHCIRGEVYTPAIAIHDRSGAVVRRSGDEITALTTLGNTIVIADQLVIATLDRSGSWARFTDGFLPPRHASAAVIRAMTPAGDNAIWAVVRSSAAPIYEFWLVTREHGALLVRPIPPRNDYRTEPFGPDSGITSIDTDASGCIIYFTTGINIARFNGCAGVSMPNFTTDPAQTIRVLPDGGVLAGSANNLRRYDRNGYLVATISLPGIGQTVGSLALDNDPRLAWVLMSDGVCGSTPARLLQVNIESREVVAQRETDYLLSDYRVIAVVGGWYARIGTSTPPPRPRPAR